jgi:hypothetical protein
MTPFGSSKRMTTALKQLVEQVEQLDPAMQAMVVEKLQQAPDEALADARWEQLLNSPEGKAAGRRLAKEALVEYLRGETEEGGF